MTSLEVGNPAGKPQASFDPQFAAKVAGALNDPFTQMQLLNQFWDYLTQRIAVAGIPVSISQVTGFSQFNAESAEVATSETTASTTFTDLATAGPTLSGLSDGSYVVLLGCWASSNTAGQAADMSVQVNSAAVDGNDGVRTFGTTGPEALARAVVKTLSNDGDNTITAKYRASGGGATATFVNRWLVALRYANA